MSRDPAWRSRSFWLSGHEYDPTDPLDTSTQADVAIVGGGFTGLWAALLLKEADPSLDVVLVEREVAGYGGSGRNGGFAMTLLDVSLHALARNHGDTRAKDAHLAVARSIREIGEFAAAHGIDCEYELNGYLQVATNPSQERRVQLDLAAAERLGLAGWEALDRTAARSLLDSPRIRAGAVERTCAILNPAKLAHGLRRVATERGVRVFEGSRVTGFEARPDGVRFHTPSGVVAATRGVLAVNPWTRDFPPLARLSIPVYTYARMSEPLSDEQLARIGWSGRQGVEDRRNYIHYFRLTKQNRILWAGQDAIYFYGSRIGSHLDRRAAVYRHQQRTFDWFFPQLAGLRFPYRWGGPVAVTVDFLPLVGTMPQTTLHYAFGCNGHGVGPAHTWGKILRDLCLGRESDLTDLLFVGRKQIAFPPEPLCWIGAEATRRALKQQDAAAARGKPVGDLEPWVLRTLRKIG